MQHEVENTRLELTQIRDSLLVFVSTPDRAVLTLLVGLLLVYRELARPGRVAPGILGAVAAITAIITLARYPLTVTGVAYVVVGVALIVFQAFRSARWVPGVVGTGMLFAGTRLALAPPYRVSMLVAACAIPFGGITVFLLRIAVRARRNKVSGQQSG